MKQIRLKMFKKPWVLFIGLSVLLAALFFLFPINLFDGVIVYKKQRLVSTIETPLSLSYFIGLGYDNVDIEDVETFYLTTKGMVMAFIFILGLPGMLAYRSYLKK
tara:strand:+ start:16527 stop:16841 length:315 start_codon:yes stop_codon:yes gene_type:complete